MGKRSSARRTHGRRIVIRCKKSLFFWCLGTAIFFGLISVLCIHGMMKQGPRGLTGPLLLLITASMTVVSMAGCVYYGVNKPRLILDAQHLRLRHRTRAVVGQIPYRNIASLEIREDIDEWTDQYGHHSRKWYFLEIVLINRKDPETWWTKFERNREFDVEIPDEFQRSISWIRNRLLERMACCGRDLPDPSAEGTGEAEWTSRRSRSESSASRATDSEDEILSPLPAEPSRRSPGPSFHKSRTRPELDEDQGHSSVGVIVACVVGGVLTCLVVGLLIWWVVGRNNKGEATATNDPPSEQQPPKDRGPNGQIPAATVARYESFARLPVRDGKGADGPVKDGPLKPSSELWNRLRDQAVNRGWQKGPAYRGRSGQLLVEDVPPEGGLLIGLNLIHDQFISAVQPIYLTRDGEKTGVWIGPAKGRIVTVKAEAGYAVGALNIRAGDVMDAINVVFMRVTESGLDTKDAYQSSRFGGNGGDPFAAGGDGAFLVGLHARTLANPFVVPAGAPATLGVMTWKP